MNHCENFLPGCELGHLGPNGEGLLSRACTEHGAIEQTLEVSASRVTTAERDRALADNAISDAAGASLRQAA